MRVFASTKTADNSAAHLSSRSRSANDSEPHVFNTPPSGIPLLRKALCTCGGRCPACQAKSNDLKVSQPSDPAEIEADHIAERVMRMPEPLMNRSSAPVAGVAQTVHRESFDSGVTPLMRRSDSETEQSKAPEDKMYIQRFAGGSAVDGVIPENLMSNLGSGSQLNSQTRSFFEPRFGTDFSRVRIHSDSRASESASAFEAKAFTIGRNVVFGGGLYQPGMSEGRQLIAHELAHVIQQTGSSESRQNRQKSASGTGGTIPSQKLTRVDRMIQREPTYPRRATRDQIINEARRVTTLKRDQNSDDATTKMWSNVASNFGSVTAGSIARRIWTHIFVRHFTEPEFRGDVESSHPRYFYSKVYGWIDAQHFFGFIDFAEAKAAANPGNQQAAFDAATAQGLSIEEKQQIIRDYVLLQHEPARDATRLMQVRPPNTPFFRLPVAAVQTVTLAAADMAASSLPGAQGQLYSQLDPRQKAKFFVDSAKSAFTFEDFASNQLGTSFFFQHGATINAAPVADRERLFFSALSTFLSGIGVETDQQRIDELAKNLPPIERFAAPKTTEAKEKQKHSELFRPPVEKF
jgi:hypothetical protein